MIYETHPDLIIMARELPLARGEDPCLRIRQACYLPIIALGTKDEAVETLELGADAYMTKPPNLRELVARVKALLRRQLKNRPPKDDSESGIGDHLPMRGTSSDGLTRTEYRLASYLLNNRGRLLGYHRLISEVWGGKVVSLDTLHFYMRRLRQKAQDYFLWRISNCRGVGYCLEE